MRREEEEREHVIQLKKKKKKLETGNRKMKNGVLSKMMQVYSIKLG